MAALAKERDTIRRLDGNAFRHPIKAATKCYAGGLAVLDASGDAAPGTVATTLTAIGMFTETVDNTGAAGAKSVDVESGVFKFANVGTITRAHIGDNAYIVDDQTVTEVTTGASIAGKILQVDSDGVWVRIGL